MAFYTYILRCSDDTYYTGHTDNLDRRIAEHQSGHFSGYTSARLPIALVWSEYFSTRDEARTAELKIKPWSRDKQEALIAGYWEALSAAAIPPRERAQRQAGPSTSLGMDGVGSPAARPRTVDLQHPQIVHPEFPETVHPERSRGIPQRQRPLPRQAHPAIILVRPQLGENIGKAARAMLNFGLTDLRLVAPRDGWPNPQAGPAASGADAVLEQARVFETVAEAVAGCTHVYASTVRKRGVTKPVVTPEAAAGAIHADPGRAAILFGPERSGLDSDDVALARTIVTVPINPDFGSLNLAQAVILIAYEWSKGVALASPPHVDLLPPAPQDELDGMLAQLDDMLVPAGYYFPPDRADVTRRTLRTLLTKPGWNSLELRTLRGVLSKLARPRRPD